MTLTENQKLLVRGLKLLGVEEKAVIGIGLSLQTEEQVEQMLDFLLENPQATQCDILKQVVIITDNSI